jgi:hypothetical protein
MELCLLRPIARRVWQWLLMFVDPSPIAQVDIATEERTFFGTARLRSVADR